MRRKTDNWITRIAVFDQVLAAVVLAWRWRFDLFPSDLSLIVPLLLIPFWTRLFTYFGVYDSHRIDSRGRLAARILTASVVGFGAVSGVLVAAGWGTRTWELAEFAFGLAGLVLLSRSLLYALLRTMRRRGSDPRFVCVIGQWEHAIEMADRFRRNPQWGLRISTVGVGPVASRTFFRFEGGPFTGQPPNSQTVGSNLEEVLKSEVVDELLIISRPEDIPAEHDALRFSREFGLQCRVRLLGEGLHDGREPSREPTWTANDVRPNLRALSIKRSLDLVLSSLLLVLLSPVIAITAILVKLSSPGPVFFTQTRVGLRGRKFVLVKFRTMVAGAESLLHLVAHRNITGGPTFKDVRDVRVTDIGRFLRRFSLDELPQLYNVFRGDMSLVGPRPLPVHECVAIEGRFRRRFNMKPGITCRWQVQGRNEIGFAQWMELDVAYVDNWTLAEDFRLLLQTIPAVLSGRGAY